jgi:nitroreductase
MSTGETMEKIATTDYPIHELLARRWSPRALDPRPIPADRIRSIFEAARWSASSFNEQPWSFIVARHEDREAFAKVAGCLMAGNKWAENAGLLILTVVKRNFTRNDRLNRVAQHDLGLAAASMTLQAEHFGLRVHQMAGLELDKVRETFAIPDSHEPVTAIAIGYPGEADSLPEGLREPERAPRERKPQGEFVFAGAWNEPASF